MLGGKEKLNVLQQSKGLIFPVLWNEPFGLSIVESLYFGCPVFATPYGSLPEIVNKEVGFLSAHSSELCNAIQHSSQFDRKKCHDYAIEFFNSATMAKKYVEKYELVLNGKKLNAQKPQLKEIQNERFLPWD
jgi:glycosyltransferase involved in cell wall biosynthesis